MVPTGQWRELEEFWRLEADADPRDALRAFTFQHRYDTASWALKFVNHTMEVMMARGRGKAGDAPKASGTAWTQFVDIPLAGVLWSDIEHELGSTDTLVDAVDALCRANYRVGVSFNQGNDSFIVSVTCRDDASSNFGKTFTAFGQTWVQALQVALYKHYFVAHEEWPTPGAPKQLSMFG